MKKNLMFAMFGAIALTGAVGLSSCSESEDVAELNPSYNPKTDEVNVDFVLNISTNSKSTRMPATTVQEGTAFRGIQKAQLLTYKLPSDGSHVVDPATTCDKEFDLDLLIGAGGLKPAGPESRRVLEMALPTGTNTLLFWGKALKSTTTADYNASDNEGSITFSPNKTLGSASFSLTPCLTDAEKDELVLYEKYIAAVVTRIVQANIAVNKTQGDKTVNKSIKWSDYAKFTTTPTTVNGQTIQKTVLTVQDADPSYEGSAMSALGRILGQLFVTLNTFGDNELRNGEGRMVALLVKDIFNVAQNVLNASATTVEELSAQVVAAGIQEIISDHFSITRSQETDPATTCTWKAMSTSLVEKVNLQTTINSTFISNAKDLNKFPDGIFRLPPGAAIMVYTAVDVENDNAIKNEYNYMSTVPTYAMGDGDSFNPFNYMYPPELCYFGNSPIRVTNDTHAVSDYPDGTSNWDNDSEWAKGATGHNNTEAWTKNGHVMSSTRSVAMQENINYGTAMLTTTIKYNTNKLYDNNAGLHTGERANEITVTDECLELTGILVGGQPQTVGWNYLPKGENPFSTMVYDNTLVSTAIPATGPSSSNYTLVWDNWNVSKLNSDQNTVYVALQFKNKTGKDFWGMNNIIRNDATFYIIGTLDPDDASDAQLTALGKTKEQYKQDKKLGVTWPNDGNNSSTYYYSLPPYDSEGKTIQQRRVFIQDYNTEANFVIGANSLKYALVSVPDLRSTQISLGLSVDLKWSKGLIFDDVVIGGD